MGGVAAVLGGARDAEIVGDELDVEAAGIGGGGGEAGFVAVDDEDVGALLGHVVGGGEADGAAADDDDVGVAVGMRGRLDRHAALVWRGGLQERGLELADLEHQGRGGDGFDRNPRGGEGVGGGLVRAEAGDGGGAEAALAAAHAGAGGAFKGGDGD